MQDLQHLLMLQHAEQAVQQYLEPHRSGLRAVQHQAGDVEDDVGLHHLHLHAEVVRVLVAELVQGWNQKMEKLKTTRGKAEDDLTTMVKLIGKEVVVLIK